MRMSVLTHIIQLPGTRIHRLQQLIHLLLTHLLAQIRQNIPELPDPNETREVLVEHLEAAAVLLGLAGVAEAAGPVEDAGEGVEVDCRNKSAIVCMLLVSGGINAQSPPT